MFEINITSHSFSGSHYLLVTPLGFLSHLVCPFQFSHLEPVRSGGMKVAGESYKAERWLLHSLQVHMLSAQLRPLLRHLEHTRKYYNGESRSEASVS